MKLPSVQIPELKHATQNITSFDFAYNRLFRTKKALTTDVVKDCQYFFGAVQPVLPRVLVLRKADKLALRYQCLENACCTYCRSI